MNALNPDVEYVDFTTYPVAVPEWFIDKIKVAINQYDIRNLSGGRVQAINVNSEHPLVQLTSVVLQNGGNANPDLAGILPAISVIEGDESEEMTTVGQGLRPYVTIDSDFVQQFSEGNPMYDKAERLKCGLLSDQEAQKIQSFIDAQGGPVLAMKEQYFERETANISVWTTNPQEVFLFTRLLRSVLFKLRKELAKLHAVDVQIRASRGLVNFNFGRTLFGSEFTVTFLNQFTNYRVFNTKDSGILDLCVDGFYVPVGSDDEPVSVHKFTQEFENEGQ